MRRLLAISLLLLTWASEAQTSYTNGYITNITYVGDQILIRLNVPLPTNCPAYNWASIPASNKPMQAWVLALEARGALSQVMITIYTGSPNSPYCTVTQIDPWE
jgi:hypothetical protein